jgi:DNA-binding MarR family transcriptional regulator
MGRSLSNPEVQNHMLSVKIASGLERIGESFRVLLWEHAQTHGLSPIQIQILLFIKYHDQALNGVSHLAREFQVTKPTVSDAVKSLTQKGLVEKQKSQEDRRAYFLKLTPKGQSLTEEVDNFADPLIDTIEKLDASDQTAIFRIITDLIHDLNQKGIVSQQRMCKTCRHFENGGSGAYCKLLQTHLSSEDIRLDCPEHEPKYSATLT